MDEFKPESVNAYWNKEEVMNDFKDCSGKEFANNLRKKYKNALKTVSINK